jgi:hypothetical protein
VNIEIGIILYAISTALFCEDNSLRSIWGYIERDLITMKRGFDRNLLTINLYSPMFTLCFIRQTITKIYAIVNILVKSKFSFLSFLISHWRQFSYFSITTI